MGLCSICANKSCHWYGSGTIECLDFKPETNADRIRTMTDDELAEKLATYIECDMCPGWPVTCEEKCTKYWLDWLRQEVE